MQETTFLAGNDVSVTNARFIAQGQTYAMSGITSVQSFRQDPSRKGPIILAIVGGLALLGGGTSSVVGLLLMAGAAAWWLTTKPEYSVLLNSASGEAKALASKDGQFIAKVVNALNEAIVHRG
jgi:hypothetical protein